MSRRKSSVIAFFSFFLMICFGTCAYAQTEEITVTTFYPSPYGVYQTLNLFPTDTIDPADACAHPGDLFYDDSDNELYLCVEGIWTPITGEQGTLFWQGDLGGNIYNLNTGGVGIGTNNPGAYKLNVNGNMYATKYFCSGSDLAERMKSSTDVLEPGDVVVINKELVGQVAKSTKSYDSSVVGIVSAEPGMVLGDEADTSKVTVDGVAIALAGRVPAKVVADDNPISKGDLLVTADVPGYLMKGEPQKIQPGMLVGKAMQDLSSGKGKIIIFVE